jgi:hypothetical protein
MKGVGHARTIVAAGLVLAGLLVVVALASRGQLAGDDPAGGRDGPGLPSGAFSYVYAGLLVAGVLALPFFFYIYARDTPYSASRRRRARLSPFLLVGFAALTLAIATRWGEEIREAFEQLGALVGAGDRGPDPSGAARPPAPEWLPVVVVTSVLVAGVGSVFAWRAARRRLRRPSLAETLSDALGDTLDDVADEPDPRRAIILAYARMESSLDRSGCSRREADAPLEYLSRVLRELEVAAAPVEALTDLFEHAKFSHHPVDAAMKARAIAALEAIRAELRARG